jgi:7-cyano-7-deazaguanine synthase in queuosine biosynthesis
MPKKLSKKEFNQRLKKRPFENIKLLNSLDKTLQKQRGYVYQFPKPGEEVLLLISGGLDSVVAWGWLMEKYQLIVHPVWLDRGKPRGHHEERSLTFFTDFFRKKYPHRFREPTYYTAPLPPPELTIASATDFHPDIILNNLDLQTNKSTYNTTGIIPFVFPFYAVLLSKQLRDKQGIAVKSIFLGVGADDGMGVPNQTQTALRAALMSICAATADFAWNLSSPYLERETGAWLDKSAIIKLGDQLSLPLEKTWSCYYGFHRQCGNGCLACSVRVGSFSQAGVVDKTKYLHHQPKLIQQFTKLIYRIKTGDPLLDMA